MSPSRSPAFQTALLPLLALTLAACGGGNQDTATATNVNASEDAALAVDSPSVKPQSRAIASNIVSVQASASTAGGIGAIMVVKVNGVTLSPSQVTVSSSTPQAYNFTATSTIPPGAKIDVVFTNDGNTVVNGVVTEDRNLYVDSVTVNGDTLLPSSGYIDVGAGAAAFDGANLVTGQRAVAWSGALRVMAPGAGSNIVTVKAYAAMAGNVGAYMQVHVNGQLLSPSTLEVRNAAPAQNYVFNSLTPVPAGAKVDVSFTNDALVVNGGNTEDRNLFVESVQVNGSTLQASSGVVDWGEWALAFDGLDTIAGQSGIWSDGSLRLTAPGTAMPTLVPSSFFGIHNSITNTAPSHVPYAVYRTHDADMMWAQIEPTQGSYNWSAMDARLTGQANKTVNFVLFGTPQWAATSAHQTLANQAGTVLAYPSYKTAAAAVSNTANAATFVKAVLNRYGQKIKYVEIWNEPTFDSNTSVGSFYWGTALQMKDLANAVNAAVKSVRPDVTVLCPGFASSDALKQFLAVGGGAYCDAIAWHPYAQHSIQRTAVADPRWLMEDGQTWGHYSRDILAPAEDASGMSISAIRAFTDAQTTSKGKPLYITEYGIGPSTLDEVYLSYKDQLNATQKQVYYEQLFAEAAAAGVKHFSLYKYGNSTDGDGLAGDLTDPNSGVVKAMAKIKTDLLDSGLGILGTRRANGNLTLTMSDGTTRTYGQALVP